jgi:hypothetical protein
MQKTGGLATQYPYHHHHHHSNHYASSFTPYYTAAAAAAAAAAATKEQVRIIHKFFLNFQLLLSHQVAQIWYTRLNYTLNLLLNA